jgi:hypothetical protein
MSPSKDCIPAINFLSALLMAIDNRGNPAYILKMCRECLIFIKAIRTDFYDWLFNIRQFANKKIFDIKELGILPKDEKFIICTEEYLLQLIKGKLKTKNEQLKYFNGKYKGDVDKIKNRYFKLVSIPDHPEKWQLRQLLQYALCGLDNIDKSDCTFLADYPQNPFREMVEPYSLFGPKIYHAMDACLNDEQFLAKWNAIKNIDPLPTSSEDGLIPKKCLHCGKKFKTDNPHKRYCDEKCGAAARSKKLRNSQPVDDQRRIY